MRYISLVVPLFAGYIAVSCVGLYMIKAADTWRSVSFACGFVLYAVGAALWMVILRQLPLSLAFPVAAGSLVVGTLATGYFFLHEAIPPKHVAGAALIILGIVLIAAERGKA